MNQRHMVEGDGKAGGRADRQAGWQTGGTTGRQGRGERADLRVPGTWK